MQIVLSIDRSALARAVALGAGVLALALVVHSHHAFGDSDKDKDKDKGGDREHRDNGGCCAKIGNLRQLTTTAKSTLVAAINEVDARAATSDARIGNLANLQTTAKTDLVSAINELAAGSGGQGGARVIARQMFFGPESPATPLTSLGINDTFNTSRVLACTKLLATTDLRITYFDTLGYLSATHVGMSDFVILLDGNPLGPSAGFDINQVSGQFVNLVVPVTLINVASGVSPGPHTVRIQARIAPGSTATGVMPIVGKTGSSQLTIEEVPPP